MVTHELMQSFQIKSVVGSFCQNHFVSKTYEVSSVVFRSVLTKKTGKMVTHIKDKDDLQQKLTDAGDQLVVIDFFATWCGPCRMIAPKLEELASENTSVHILKVDVDECEDLAMEYNISSMPTFVFIKNKNVVLTFSGANYDKLKATILEHK